MITNNVIKKREEHLKNMLTHPLVSTAAEILKKKEVFHFSK